MIFNWYKLLNEAEFLSEGLVSKHLDVILGDDGEAEIMVTKGNLTSLVFRDVFLPCEMEGKTPIQREGDDATYSCYKDSAGDIWLGIEVPEE